MPARELVVLGTASQAPTRYRNHNGYLLRWDDTGILFDPAGGAEFYERLRRAALYNDTVEVRPHPLAVPGDVELGRAPFTLTTRRLDHGAETLGWRLTEPDGRR